MRTRLTLTVVAALSSLLSTPVAAQWIKFPTPGIPRLPDGKPNASPPAPRTAEGKPDLSGIWRSGGTRHRYDYDVAQDLKPEEIQPWAEALRLQRVQDFRKDSPLARCLPVSLPFLNSRGLARIVQTPGLIVVLHESPNSPHRTIFTDGRQLPKDPNPTWLGYSVGHWEGDTLVVESAGFNDRSWLDRAGHPHSENLRVTERFRRVDFGHMQFQITFDDPETLTKPLSFSLAVNYRADTDMLQNVCNEDERDTARLRSKANKGVQLSPAVLARYAGTYEFHEGSTVVAGFMGMHQPLPLINAHLYLNALPLIPESETRFDSTGAAAEFFMDANGTVMR